MIEPTTGSIYYVVGVRSSAMDADSTYFATMLTISTPRTPCPPSHVGILSAFHGDEDSIKIQAAVTEGSRR